MYMKIVDSLKADLLLTEGASDFIPDLFDCIAVDGKEYQVVERLIVLQSTAQGPFQEKTFAQIITIFVEPQPERSQ